MLFSFFTITSVSNTWWPSNFEVREFNNTGKSWEILIETLKCQGILIEILKFQFNFEIACPLHDFIEGETSLINFTKVVKDDAFKNISYINIIVLFFRVNNTIFY